MLKRLFMAYRAQIAMALAVLSIALSIVGWQASKSRPMATVELYRAVADIGVLDQIEEGVNVTRVKMFVPLTEYRQVPLGVAKGRARQPLPAGFITSDFAPYILDLEPGGTYIVAETEFRSASTEGELVVAYDDYTLRLACVTEPVNDKCLAQVLEVQRAVSNGKVNVPTEPELVADITGATLVAVGASGDMSGVDYVKELLEGGNGDDEQ